MINALSKRIFDNPDFKQDYTELLKVNLHNLIDKSNKKYLSEDTEKRLLNSISIFSNAKNSTYRECALDILIKLYNNHRDLDEVKERIFINFLSVVLCNLGNFPSNSMLIRGKNEEYLDIKHNETFGVR